MFWGFLFSLRLVSNFSPLWSEKMLDMISIFWICWDSFCVLSCGLSWKILHVHLNTCVFCFFGMKGSLYISVKSISSRTLFNAIISLLIFCLEDLSIFGSGVLKYPTIIVLLSISFLKSSKIFFMYLGAHMLGAYIFTMLMSSWWILPLSIMKWPSGSLFMALFLKSILCDMSIATPVFLFLFVCLKNLFPTLHFESV